ncbi:MAG: hypothetical protein NZ604_06570 [Flavobacteriales bacterium]|nr:hypothetical protein [Flavobacteriales bacterium]
MRQKLIPQTVSFSEKEMIYREKLKKIGINPNTYLRVLFRDAINKDYKKIEREAKRLTEFKIPF